MSSYAPPSLVPWLVRRQNRARVLTLSSLVFVSPQGNPIQGNAPACEAEEAQVEVNAGSVASKWGTILAETEESDTKPKFMVSVLKVGGLATATSMPHSEEGAIDKREAINSMTNEFLVREDKYNPAFLAAVENFGAKDGVLLPKKALSFQGPKSRAGSPNELYQYAPGWTSLFWTGSCMVAKPVDVCKGIDYAITNMPEYGGIEITLIDGETSTIVSLDELEDTDITMLLPPIAQHKKRKFGAMSEEIGTLKAEIAAQAAEIKRLSKLILGVK